MGAQTASRPLDEIFPNLRQLYLTLRTGMNVSFLDRQFPYLNHFHLEMYENNDAIKRMKMIEQLKGMVLKNPTIRSIAVLFDYTPNFLQFLREALPSLERLNLDRLLMDNSDNVQFDHVKSFAFHTQNTTSINNLRKLSFPHLDSLEIIYTPNCINEWIQFFRRHTQLKQLYVHGHSDLFGKIPELNRLVASLTNLIDLTMKSHYFLGINPIAQFIRNKDQFEKIHLQFEEGITITKPDVIALRQYFQNNWTIKAIVGTRGVEKIIKGFLFIRK